MDSGSWVNILGPPTPVHSFMFVPQLIACSLPDSVLFGKPCKNRTDLSAEFVVSYFFT